MSTMSAHQWQGTMTRVTAEHLRRPAQHAARCVVRVHLAVVVALAEHGVTDDGHSLHDLRVALRRLRAWLDAYRCSLRDTVPKKLERKLHRFQQATNTTRDLEVQYVWLRKHLRHDNSSQTQGQRRFVRSLRRQYHDALKELDNARQAELLRLAKSLNRALSYYCVSIDVESHREFSMALAAVHALTTLARALRGQVTNIASLEDVPHIHRARITAKRLRYLLEPLRDSCQAAPQAIGQLSELQDITGELCDASVLRKRVSKSGQATLSRYADERLRGAQEQYNASDIRVRVDDILTEVSAVVTMLQAVAAEPLYHSVI